MRRRKGTTFPMTPVAPALRMFSSFLYHYRMKFTPDGQKHANLRTNFHLAFSLRSQSWEVKSSMEFIC